MIRARESNDNERRFTSQPESPTIGLVPSEKTRLRPASECGPVADIFWTREWSARARASVARESSQNCAVILNVSKPHETDDAMRRRGFTTRRCGYAEVRARGWSGTIKS